MPDEPKGGRLFMLGQGAQARAQQPPNSGQAQGMPKGGFLGRLVDGVRYVIADVKPSTWFSPGQPTFPVTDDPSARGRRFDYPVGYNIQIQPRIETGISFEELRNLADAYDIVRLCIETRKDQIAKTPWEIVGKDKRKKPDKARIKAARDLMLRPDGVNPFMTWVRMAAEETLVTDALTIEPRKNLKGDLVRLDLISGSTIKPILDADGRVPLPPDPAFQQVLKGVPTANFSTDDLIYAMRNPRVHKVYGFPPLEQIVLRVNTALRRDVKTLQHYTDGNIPAGIYLAPPEWTVDQLKELDDYFNSKLQGNTAAQNRVVFLAGGTGTQFIETRKVDLKDGFDEWLARVACFCFSIAPTAFVNQNNRATAEQQGDAALTEGLLPILLFLETTINGALERHGGFDDVEFIFQKEGAVDTLAAAKIDDINMKNGSKSIDEVREARGDDPIGIGHGIVTATGWVALPTKDNIKAGLAKDPLAEPKPEPDPNLKVDPPKDDGKGPKDKGPKDEPPKPDEPKLADKVEKKKKLSIKFQPDSYPHEAMTALRAVIAHFFKAQARRNAKRMSRKYAELFPGDSVKVAKADGDNVSTILNEFDIDAFGFLVDPATKYLEEAGKLSGRKAALDLQNMISNDEHSDLWGQVSAEAEDYAKRRGAQLVGKKWVDGELVENPSAKWAITGTTRDMLESVTKDAISEGMTSSEYAAAIMDSTAFSESRANMIARTEMSKAAAAGQREAWAGSGLDVTKTSVLSSTHVGQDECDDCAAQGAIAFDAEFASGELETPHHPNCACDIQYEASLPGAEEEA